MNDETPSKTNQKKQILYHYKFIEVCIIKWVGRQVDGLIDRGFLMIALIDKLRLIAKKKKQISRIIKRRKVCKINR